MGTLKTEGQIVREMVRVLQAIIDDFDQTGCSEGVGVVSTKIINEAREIMQMEPLKDEI